MVLTKTAEKFGAVGTLIAALGCAACFPALGAFAAAIGLGFLSGFEGVLINKLLPMLALLALIMNVALWAQHRNHGRGALSVTGPAAVLATLYPLWTYGWSTYLFYLGLGLMLTMSTLSVVRPAKRRSPEAVDT